jgi:enolase
MVFIVLRHGESVWNKENRFTGLTDVLLSENGKMEAREAGYILRNVPFDTVFTSTLQRTIDTGSIIAAQQRVDQPPRFRSDTSLCERDYGNLTGKNKTELAELYGPELVKTWRRSYFDGPPQGENLDDVTKRAGKYYDEHIAPLLAENRHVLLVSHGNTLRALFVHLGIKTEKTVESFEIPTGVPIQINTNTKEYRMENLYELSGYQIIDSRGYPTIEVQCKCRETNRIIGKGSSPSGASCGSTEVLELRDKDKTKYHGKSVFQSVDNVAKLNNHFILNEKMMTNVKKCDEQLIKYDPSPMKSDIGGNTTTAVSFCMADVGANMLQIPLYEYFHKIYNVRTTPICKEDLPTPLVNIINGGKHSVTGELKIQEFMIFPKHDFTVSEKTQLLCEIYHTLKQILVEKYGEAAKSIGDEGGFCPPIYTAEEALSVIEEAIEKSHYKANDDVYIALDCAASEFYDEETKLYEIEEGRFLSNTELVDYYGELMRKHPALKSIEDGFHEQDYAAWIQLTEQYGDNMMIVGDDLFTTNPRLIKQGLEEKWANTLLLKVNQIGTISEAVEGAQMLLSEGKDVIVSHRSGETNHAYIVDLAVGIGAKFLKIGSPCRGERVAKFNRLLEIEHNLV